MIPIEKKHTGIYIHFPYCIQKCEYCDFYSIGIGKDSIKDEKLLFDAFKNEIIERIKLEPSLEYTIIDSIFLGGGTPSKSNILLLENFLNWIFRKFNFSKSIEITIECNPEDLSLQYLTKLNSIGFNRVSIGIQSFDLQVIQFLGRFYNETSYKNIPELLSLSPIKNISTDLIYGIPTQTEESFFNDLKLLIHSNISHISLYSLTNEKNTIYSKKIKDGEKQPPNEDFQINILKLLPNYLKSFGFNQYEISNYSKPNFESTHNLTYWTLGHYLGIGPAAHGFTSLGRYANSRSIDNYLKHNFSRNYEPSNFQEELGLCLFRLFCPIPLDSFLDNIPKKKSKIKDYLFSLQSQDLCKYTNGFFQWEPHAITHLDSYISEICLI